VNDEWLKQNMAKSALNEPLPQMLRLSIIDIDSYVVLWFKFVFGWTIFELVSILFAILPDYGNEYMIKEIKNELVLKILHPK